MATLDDTGPLKWPAYSALDVARFAVAGRLFDVGFTYDQSARIVEHAVDPLLTPGVTPPPGFFAGLHLEFQPSAFGLVPGITRCRKAGAFSLHEIMSPVIRRLSLPIGRSAAAPEIGHAGASHRRPLARADRQPETNPQLQPPRNPHERPRLA